MHMLSDIIFGSGNSKHMDEICLSYLTRLPSKAKAQMASGQGSHWLIESLKCFHLCVTRPPEMCQPCSKHILAASSYTISR